MNKSDIKLIVVVLFLILVFYLLFDNNAPGTNAIVKYNGSVIDKLDLTKDNCYTYDGALGDVVVNVSNGYINIEKENSPKHICKKQGKISKSGESLICLPNLITIEIESNDAEYDSIVR